MAVTVPEVPALVPKIPPEYLPEIVAKKTEAAIEKGTSKGYEHSTKQLIQNEARTFFFEQKKAK